MSQTNFTSNLSAFWLTAGRQKPSKWPIPAKTHLSGRERSWADSSRNGMRPAFRPTLSSSPQRAHFWLTVRPNGPRRYQRNSSSATVTLGSLPRLVRLANFSSFSIRLTKRISIHRMDGGSPAGATGWIRCNPCVRRRGSAPVQSRGENSSRPPAIRRAPCVCPPSHLINT